MSTQVESVRPATVPARWPRPTGPAAPIARLSAPLIAFFFIQTAISLTSLAMMGRLGNAVLAGTGAGGTVFGFLLALVFGIDAAVQPKVSRAVGAADGERLGQVLVDALVLAIPLGLGLAAALWVVGPPIVAALLSDDKAALAGAGYVRGAAPSLLFLAITTSINACWIGSGRPARAFLVTAFLAPVQIVTSLVLMFGWGPIPAQGAAGAGAAISISALVGLALQGAMAVHRGAIPGFPRARPRLAGVAAIAALGWPISLQQSFAQVGLIVAYGIVAHLGVASVAAINVLIALTTVPVQIAVGFGVAAGTLVGQALGRGDPAEARRWGWRTAMFAMTVTAPLGLIAALAPAWLLGLFLKDPATLAIALLPIRILGLGVLVDTLARVLCFAIRGAGATRIGAGVPFAGLWLVQLPLMAWVAVGLGFGVLGLTGVQVTVAAAEAAATAWVWAGAFWVPRANR